MCQGLGPRKHDEISEIDRISYMYSVYRNRVLLYDYYIIVTITITIVVTNTVTTIYINDVT